ncbi:MAG: ethanolamine ammonia-lyase subunit EutC [Pseudomonadota bacterium]
MSDKTPDSRLADLTPARVRLGRYGSSLPTKAHLKFQLDHAKARDAVRAAFDPVGLAAAIEQEVIVLRSRAKDRPQYLRRPDLGRQPHPDDLERLPFGPFDLAILVVDGLSAKAVHAHAASMVIALKEKLPNWSIAPVCAVHQGRVAVGDLIASRLGASLACVLIGERPGLSAPDSLGAYLTWEPRVGRLDSERNCVSNIRPPDGLSYEEASDTLARLLHASRSAGLTGVGLKDGARSLPPAPKLY